MKKSTMICFIVLFVILVSNCKRDDPSSSSKKDPIITWATPSDISFGTLLSVTQLNATANVPGTFIYSPPIGTKLNEGTNQDMKVDFTPTDAATYNAVSKTVKINVTKATGSGGVSSIVFNQSKIYGTVTDIDGNVYKTIIIGTQTWMAENLRTTNYRNGESIPNVTDNTVWTNLTTGAYCNYENTIDKDKIATYGRLYNWYTIADYRILAPKGWHVPSDTEWETLTRYLGNEMFAGGKMKEIGTTHWNSPNKGATNESGFSSLPGGFRFSSFSGIGELGFYWSSLSDQSNAYIRNQNYNYSNNFRSGCGMRNGLSIRCIKD